MTVQEITEARMSITAARPIPRTETQPARVVPGVRMLLPLSLASAGLLWLCYFPMALGWLAWVALVPLLMLVRSPARPRTIYLSAYAGGLLFYLLAIQWMRVADDSMYVTWIALSIYCAVYFPLAIFLSRWLDRRTSLPLTCTLPVIWTALEFSRSHLATGFSWYLIGHTQHDFLPLIQIADLTGVYGVSFLVVAVNALIVELYSRGRGRLRSALVQCLLVAAALGATLGYGHVRITNAVFTPGPRLALVQGNVPQAVRNDSNLALNCLREYKSLTHPASSYHPDLIAWPETSQPANYYAVAPGVGPQSIPAEWIEPLKDTRALVEGTPKLWPTNVLFGLNSYILESGGDVRTFNSALLIDRDGKMAGRYDKFHRVPFGEYVPLVDTFPFMKKLSPYKFEYGITEGHEHTQFHLADKDGTSRYSFGVVICYEDTVPELALPYSGNGSNPTDFILNISNDGWFDGTAEHEEHLAISRFRAVECRRSLARVANMGVSVVIDGNGRVLKPREIGAAELPGHILPGSHIWSIPVDPKEQEGMAPSEWKNYKKVAGLLLATIPIDSRSSFYAKYGDWLPWSCWALLGAAIAISLFRRRELSLVNTQDAAKR